MGFELADVEEVLIAIIIDAAGKREVDVTTTGDQAEKDVVTEKTKFLPVRILDRALL